MIIDDRDNVVIDDPPPSEALAITLDPVPGDGVVASKILTVSGEVTVAQASVTVNGIPANLADRQFSLDVELFEGTNTLVVAAQTEAGESASATAVVRLDTAAPLIVIESPRAGDRLVATSVAVAGTVNDIIPGATVNSDDVAVTINGVPAVVNNRTFFIAELPLVAGSNRLEAVATDRAGNVGNSAIEISSEMDLAGLRMSIVEGNAQEQPIGETLPVPLKVQLQGNDGVPLAGRPLEFKVVRGDGSLAPDARVRSLTMLSDQDGLAEVPFALGSRTGMGFHRVRVTSPGSIAFVEFCATATTAPPQTVSIVRMPPTSGAVGQALTDPLSVIVTDGGGNPVADLEVVFEVAAGGGSFDGESSVTRLTNPDGIAEAIWTLGPQAGRANNIATARFDGLDGIAPTFVVSGMDMGDASDTRVSGIVQNSVARPIVGATAVLVGTDLRATTGEDGAFVITNVPPGGYHVRIEGAAANQAELGITYPDIDFAIEALPGVDNQLDQVVVLPFLDQDSARMVGGPEDVALTMAGSGVQIKILANSVVLADGSRGEVLMSSSQVKFDKVPMPPPQGSTPLVVGTLQPSGIHFDPPAQIIYPNAEGLAPGDVADIFAFHHDIGQFVNVGPGTVSEDGSVVTSDPGFGIVQSGWHCLIRLPGQPANCTNDCEASVTWEVAGMSGTEQPVLLASGQEGIVTASFSPMGMLEGSWVSSNPDIVSVTGGADGLSATIVGNTAGSATLTSPISRIALPAEEGGDKQCQVQLDVQVGKVEFGGANVRIVNLNENRVDLDKSVAVIWDASMMVDLSIYLTPDSARDGLVWEGTDTDSSILAYGSSPSADEVRIAEVTASLETCGNAPQCSDSMYVVIVPEATQTSFANWVQTQSADTEWLEELPPLYNSVGNPAADPEPDACQPELWESPDLRYDSEYHPGAAREIRSEETAGGHGHQATYNEAGQLIRTGVAAGTADRRAPSIFSTGHLDLDVKPFIWAAQLDANPVEAGFLYLDLDGPLIHEGAQLRQYLTLRPPIANAKPDLAPGTCAQ